MRWDAAERQALRPPPIAASAPTGCSRARSRRDRPRHRASATAPAAASGEIVRPSAGEAEIGQEQDDEQRRALDQLDIAGAEQPHRLDAARCGTSAIDEARRCRRRSSAISDRPIVHSAPWPRNIRWLMLRVPPMRLLTTACRAGDGAETARGRAPRSPPRISSDRTT